MAIVTITLTDIDLDSGSYQAALDVKDHKIDDGQATAAHFTGHYIYQMIHTPEFRDSVLKYAEALVAANPERSIANADVIAQQGGAVSSN
ncbi:hypothetical protein LAV_00042 [Sphingobium phage Lacusarx]|uniref:Uncharacterized protein n=1 Tax=Sphingobium phage Lacusarx TaxID=1980139 RepID=A0A1W6DXE9_9CAUD|nr:hypothetical protein FDH44_gp042 [Sphingobium phage Lacusarx]ARK07442.1 hypothetical protein LAV_00042 [Sphingobium phage Lacusarx]